MILIAHYEAMELAGLAGELLLTNGAETYRVEDTIRRICNGAGFTETEVIVFPTGIIINGKIDNQHFTNVKRIQDRDINLAVVSEVNDISRKFADGKITLKEGFSKIKAIKSCCSYDRSIFIKMLVARDVASGASSLLFGGSWSDFVSTVVVTTLIIIINNLTAFNLAYIIRHYLAGLLAGFIGSLFVEAGFGEHLDKIVVGALIPLFPGVAITNAVRDFISGDLLSGTLRMVEALLIAIALAGGVGFALSIYF